jgi:hypothetical protein
MNAKNTVVGTAKKLVAEIVGDGRLAEEGTRQAAGLHPVQTTPTSDPIGGGGHSPPQRSIPPENPTDHAALTDEERYAALLGHAALKVWSDLPREAQELLFTASVDDGIMANSLAVFLHDRHPRTAHPPKPTRFA